MKIKKIAMGLLAAGMLASVPTTTFAATKEKGNCLDNLSANVKTYDVGEILQKPANAIEMNKKVVKIEKVSGGIKIHVDDQIPQKIENAVAINKKAIRIEKSSEGIKIYTDVQK
ncbi:hypothetical protein [Clostridium lundense]|uniref:hypothetical protein n=1 Tax=Clostridium lundense TaxID=319475 RepID=UPI000484BE1F|nr:hypothetical protein [Clostridium lundense]